jgi:hypothetical protein
MVSCNNCGHEGSLVGFPYVAQAEGAGLDTLRRCPARGELIIARGFAARDEDIPSSEPWCLSNKWGRRLFFKDREVEK